MAILIKYLYIILAFSLYSIPSQAEEQATSSVPNHSFYSNSSDSTYIKPVLKIAGGFNHQFLENEGQTTAGNQTYDNRLTTLSIVQFGLKGKLAKGLSFHFELEKNLGNYGTSVWGGTSSLQTRQNWLKYEKMGASIMAGVIIDPASVDFMSNHVLEMLGRDPTVANLPFYGGINMGQGVVFQYKYNFITAGFTFSSVNPLATTLSWGFGGAVAAIGNIYFMPTKTMSMGNPGSNAQISTYSPSLIFKYSIVELRAVFQYYSVNIDTLSIKDKVLQGENYKASLKLNFFNGEVVPFVNANYRRNEMLLQTGIVPDITTKSDDLFVGYTISGGIDYNYSGNNGIGVYYGEVNQEPGKLESTYKTLKYLNIGTTYWLIEDTLALGIKYATLVTMTDGDSKDSLVDMNTYTIGLRMQL